VLPHPTKPHSRISHRGAENGAARADYAGLALRSDFTKEERKSNINFKLI
jgi:hypothetical protein